MAGNRDTVVHIPVYLPNGDIKVGTAKIHNVGDGQLIKMDIHVEGQLLSDLVLNSLVSISFESMT